MTTLKYSVIKNKEQYNAYCKALETLLADNTTNSQEVELLTLLIEHYDAKNKDFNELDPIELLKSLMQDYSLRPKDLANYLDISEGYVSDTLDHKKGLSKEVIRKLAGRFRLSQEAFNRPFRLHVTKKSASE